MILHYLTVSLLVTRAKPVRSTLSLLGIYIGVLALIIILAAALACPGCQCEGVGTPDGGTAQVGCSRDSDCPDPALFSCDPVASRCVASCQSRKWIFLRGSLSPMATVGGAGGGAS